MNVHASREKTGPSLGFCFSSLFMMTSGPRTRVERRSEPSDLFDPDPMAWKRAPWEATLKPVATAKGIPLPSQCGTDGTKVCATLVGFLLDVFSVPRAHALGKSSVQNPPPQALGALWKEPPSLLRWPRSRCVKHSKSYFGHREMAVCHLTLSEPRHCDECVQLRNRLQSKCHWPFQTQAPGL